MNWFETVKKPDYWLNRVNNPSDWEFSDLSTSGLGRCELQEKISELTNNTRIPDSVIKKSLIEIFAWGDMKTVNARKALPCIENYQEICKSLLCSELTPFEAYKEFFVAHHSRELEGMGPAYYTKLIYFLGDQTGLILDQWTARSINTLCEEPVIKLKPNENGMTVCNSNGPKTYKIYLEIVEELRAELNLDTLPKTEELIFSCSDRDPNVINRLGQYHQICSAWRKYVREQESKY